MDQTQRGKRERDRVREREGGDGPHQRPRLAHDQEQGEDEQQVIVSAENVLDSVHDERARDRQTARLAMKESRPTVATAGPASWSWRRLRAERARARR